MSQNKLNLFFKTRFSLLEEDRITNSLLIVLQHSGIQFTQSFLDNFDISFNANSNIFIQDHVPYSSNSVVDGEIFIPKELRIAIETKIHSNKFNSDKQILKYYNILLNKKEKRKILLLISPDYKEPKILKALKMKSTICSIKWLSWRSVYDWLIKEKKHSKRSQITNYLINELIEYMELLNLIKRDVGKVFKNNKYESKLKYILGNETAEKVLINIFHYKSAYANRIARNSGIPVNGVQQQLGRFEEGDILIKEKKDNVVLYSFNLKNPFIDELYEMLEKVYISIPPEDKKKLFNPEYVLKKY